AVVMHTGSQTDVAEHAVVERNVQRYVQHTERRDRFVVNATASIDFVSVRELDPVVDEQSCGWSELGHDVTSRGDDRTRATHFEHTCRAEPRWTADASLFD